MIRRILIVLTLVLSGMTVTAAPASAHSELWPYCGHGTDSHYLYSEKWIRSEFWFGRHMHTYRNNPAWFVWTRTAYDFRRDCS